MSAHPIPANDNDKPQPAGPKPGGSAKYGMCSNDYAANDSAAVQPFTFHQADCLDVLANIPEQSINLIYTDLPYGTTACPWDSIIDLEQLWGHYKRIITPTGVIVLHAAQPFTTVLAYANLPWLKESLVWEKSRATGFLQSKQRHLKKHEDILVFSPGTVVSGNARQTARNMTYNPQGLVKLDKPYRPRPEGNTLRPIYRPCFNGKPITGEGRNQTHTNFPTTILKYASVSKPEHPTQKPVDLAEYLVRTYSNDGDTILDNCMGSGTSGVACAVIGNRHYIGIERDPKFFPKAVARIDIASLSRAA